MNDTDIVIKKDGTVLLLGKEVGKAPHGLENIKKIELVVAGPKLQRITQTIDAGVGMATAEEIGLTIYVT